MKNITIVSYWPETATHDKFETYLTFITNTTGDTTDNIIDGTTNYTTEETTNDIIYDKTKYTIYDPNDDTTNNTTNITN